MKMKTTLLLWDIDGTLINAQGAGLEALRDALLGAFGIRDSLASIELAGRTDRWIFRRMLRSFDIAESDVHIAALESHYLSALPSRVQERGVRILPGIGAVVAEADRRESVAQGLLTGNLRKGAAIKLGHSGLWDRFPFGAFADDSENRNDLGPFAVRRAREHSGAEFNGTNTWVIGDTPHDVACGRAAGLRTMAIATGRHSVAELAASSPDALLESLEDTAAFWAAVGA